MASQLQRANPPIPTAGLLPAAPWWCAPCTSVNNCMTLLHGQRIISPRPVEAPEGELARSVHQPQEPHAGAVNAVAVFAADTRALTASTDRTLKVWDLKTFTVRHTLQGHGQAVNCCEVLAGSTLAVSGSADWSLKVWDLQNLVCVATLTGHAGGVTAVATLEVPRDYYGDSGGDGDGKEKEKEKEKKKMMMMMMKKKERGGASAAAADGYGMLEKEYSTDGEGGFEDVRLAEDESGDEIKKDKPSWAINGSVHTSTSTKSTEEWALEKIGRPGWNFGSMFGALGNPGDRRGGGSSSSSSSRISSSPQPPVWRKATKTLVVSGSRDGSVKVWDLEARRCVRTMEGHEGAVKCVATFGGGRSVRRSRSRSRSRRGGGGFAAAPNGASSAGRRGSPPPPASNGQRRGGQQQQGGGSNGLESELEQLGRELEQRWGENQDQEAGSAGAAVVDDDDADEAGFDDDNGDDNDGPVRVLSGGADGAVRVWDLGTGGFVHGLVGHTGAVNSCAVFTLRRRRPPQQQQQQQQQSPPSSSGGSGGGGFVEMCLTASEDLSLRVWDLERGECVKRLAGHDELVTSCAVYGSDGGFGPKLGISCSFDETLKVWDLRLPGFDDNDDEEEEEEEEEEGEDEDAGDGEEYENDDEYKGGGVNGVNGGPNGNGKNPVRRRRTRKGRVRGGYDPTSDPCLATLVGHEAGVTSCVVFRNGEMAASGSFDKTLKLWDIPSDLPLPSEPSEPSELSELSEPEPNYGVFGINNNHHRSNKPSSASPSGGAPLRFQDV